MAQVKLIGKLFWAKHMEVPNTEFNQNETRYEICVGDLSDTLAARLKDELNVKIKQRDNDKYNRGKYIVIKCKFPIRAVDEKGNPVTPEQIGNGTVAELSVGSYPHKMTAMHGNAPTILQSKDIAGLKIKELVAPPTAEESAVTEEDVVL